jgi:chromosomal replication initiation ATPase DnaA
MHHTITLRANDTLLITAANEAVQIRYKPILLAQKKEPIDLEKTITQITRLFGVTEEEIKGTKRSVLLVMVRCYLAHLLRSQWPPLTLAGIGKILKRDHSTIIHYMKMWDSFESISDGYFVNFLNKIADDEKN